MNRLAAPVRNPATGETKQESLFVCGKCFSELSSPEERVKFVQDTYMKDYAERG
ncbi:hypothetical protein [Corallococcus sp. EGB]|uniref:hypothetical protein n=1 Tax=Corallococcus sp. EGB TaxID=1521117 RepID=UPI001CBAC062|nr:hypothetical protein [Corallococcus sp. EGB]